MLYRSPYVVNIDYRINIYAAPHGRASCPQARRNESDPLRLHEPWAFTVSSRAGPSTGTPLLQRGHSETTGAERSAAQSRPGGSTQPRLGTPGSGFGDHAH